MTDRELASLILIGFLALWVISRPGGRSGLVSVMGGFLTPKIAIPFLAYAIYIAAVVGTFGNWSQLWEPRLLKDTAVWFAVSGTLLLFRFGDAAKPGFVSARVRGSLRASVFVEFYLNLISFSLLWELALQVTATFLTTLNVVAAHDLNAKSVARLSAILLASLGAALLAITGWQLVGEIGAIDLPESARDFLLPFWLTMTSVPFILLLALWAHYETAFLRIDFVAKDQKAGRRAKLALLVGLGLRNPDVAHFGGAWQQELVEAPTWRAALSKLREYRKWRAATEAAKQKAADDLVMYEGVTGSDEEGRQLDRREFAETIKALESVSTAHMSWYGNPPGGRYKAKVADVISAFTRELPDDHGIQMRTRKDGQAWYAWRRTVSGWVFAIGAAGPPPDQRFYDGPEPPDAFPGSDPTWGSQFERGPNWDV